MNAVAPSANARPLLTSLPEAEIITMLVWRDVGFQLAQHIEPTFVRHGHVQEEQSYCRRGLEDVNAFVWICGDHDVGHVIQKQAQQVEIRWRVVDDAIYWACAQQGSKVPTAWGAWMSAAVQRHPVA